MKNSKRILRTLNGEKLDIPPVWLMRQAGRYLPEYLKTRAEAGSFLELCYSPQLAAEVTMQPLRRFHFDAAILFSDILVIPHALGQKVDFAENHGPVLGDLPSDLHFDDVKFHHHLNPVYETIEVIQQQMQAEGFSEKTALIGFSGAPWTLACYMVDRRGSKDFAATRLMAFQEPEKFGALIDILTHAVAQYLLRQIHHGAEIIQIFDSWAGVLSPDQFRTWVIEPTNKIIGIIRQQHPDIPIIGFPKGAGVLSPDYAKINGLTALGLDTQMPPAWAASHIDPQIVLQGNLDPFSLVAGGKQLERGVEGILEAFKDRPFIFNLGHGIDKSTPPHHVSQLLEIIRHKSQ